jgi:hypothetical protein
MLKERLSHQPVLHPEDAVAQDIAVDELVDADDIIEEFLVEATGRIVSGPDQLDVEGLCLFTERAIVDLLVESMALQLKSQALGSPCSLQARITSRTVLHSPGRSSWRWNPHTAFGLISLHC